MKFSSLLDFYDARLTVLETITLSKSEVWRYEKEWRVITTLRDKSLSHEILPYAPEEVGAVFLGCKMTPEDRSELSTSHAAVMRRLQSSKLKSTTVNLRCCLEWSRSACRAPDCCAARC